jgi:hypothetical protein
MSNLNENISRIKQMMGLLNEQSDTSFLDNKVNYLIQQGYKVVDNISLPDGEYNLIGFGYTCHLIKDGKNTGYSYVTTGGIRGSWENQKVNVMGGKIQKVLMGEVYKILYNQTKVGHVGFPVE